MAQGLWPDVVASDWLSDKYNYSPYTKNLMFILTKYLELGMPLQQALATVTATPARLMGMEGRIGTLPPARMRMWRSSSGWKKRSATWISTARPLKPTSSFIPQMVLSDGEFAFCQADFALA